MPAASSGVNIQQSIENFQDGSSRQICLTRETTVLHLLDRLTTRSICRGYSSDSSPSRSGRQTPPKLPASRRLQLRDMRKDKLTVSNGTHANVRRGRNRQTFISSPTPSELLEATSPKRLRGRLGRAERSSLVGHEFDYVASAIGPVQAELSRYDHPPEVERGRLAIR
jgi:hypothetical protein